MVGYFLTGLIYVIATSAIFGVIGNSIGIQPNTDLKALFSISNPFGIILGVISFMILGALVWVFAWIGVEIRNHIEGKKDVKLGHRPYLMTLAVVGIITTVVFYALGQVLSGISPNVDLSNVNTLLSAIMTFNPLFIVMSFFAISTIGYLVARLAKGIPVIDREVPKELKQI